MATKSDDADTARRDTDSGAGSAPAAGDAASPSEDELQSFQDAMAWAGKVSKEAETDSENSELLGTSAAVAMGGLFESGTLALSQAMFASVGNMQQSAILSQASTAANVRKMLASDSETSSGEMIRLIESLARVLRPTTTDITVQD